MIKRSFTVLGLGALALAAGSLAFTQPATAAAEAHSHAPFVPGGVFKAAPGAHAAAKVGNRVLSYSGNWSGYAVTGGTFSTTTATWVQPAASCSKSDGDTDMSPWVGLDGYTSSTVEQTGTSADCDGSTVDYYAWYEMYPSNYVTINHTVKAGDSFTGTVTHTSGTSYTLTLTDNTQKWTNTVSKKLSADDSSAEAVLEMAADNLTKFTTDPFTSFTVDGEAIGSYTGSQYTIQQMEIDTSSGSLCDSTSGLTSNENFTVSWLSAC
jgi:Peptidase A4 family